MLRFQLLCRRDVDSGVQLQRAVSRNRGALHAETGDAPGAHGRAEIVPAGRARMKRLDGKRCLVTGGSRGLGLSIARPFAAAGARVAFTYSRRVEDAEDAAAQIRAAGGAPPLVFRGSVADSAHVKTTVAALVAEWGGID